MRAVVVLDGVGGRVGGSLLQLRDVDGVGVLGAGRQAGDATVAHVDFTGGGAAHQIGLVAQRGAGGIGARAQGDAAVVGGDRAHADGDRVLADGLGVGAGGVGVEVLGAGVVDVLDTVADGRHIARHRGDAVIDGRDLVIGGLQLAAIDGVGAGVAEFRCGDVGDLVGTGAAVLGAIGARAAVGGRVPQQGVVLQAGHAVVHVGDAVVDIGDLGVGLVQLRHVDGIAVAHAASDVGDLGATSLGDRVVGVTRHRHGVVRAVVVLDGVGGRRLQLRDVDGIRVFRAGGQAIDLPGLAAGGVTQAQGAQRALPGGAGVGGSYARARIVARDGSAGRCLRARAQRDAVADRGHRAITQRKGVGCGSRRSGADGNGVECAGLGFCPLTYRRRAGRRSRGLIADRCGIVASSIGGVAQGYRAALGRVGIQTQSRARGSACRRLVAERRSCVAACRGVSAYRRGVRVLRYGRKADGDSMVVGGVGIQSDGDHVGMGGIGARRSRVMTDGYCVIVRGLRQLTHCKGAPSARGCADSAGQRVDAGCSIVVVVSAGNARIVHTVVVRLRVGDSALQLGDVYRIAVGRAPGHAGDLAIQAVRGVSYRNSAACARRRSDGTGLSRRCTGRNKRRGSGGRTRHRIVTQGDAAGHCNAGSRTGRQGLVA